MQRNRTGEKYRDIQNIYEEDDKCAKIGAFFEVYSVFDCCSNYKHACATKKQAKYGRQAH